MALINVANMIIYDNKGRILLVKREFEGKYYWSIPGGKCEEGETFEDAVRREIKEEINCKIISLAYLDSTYLKRNEEKSYRVAYFYGKVKGKIKINEELKEYKWFLINGVQRKKLSYLLNQGTIINNFIKLYKKDFKKKP